MNMSFEKFVKCIIAKGYTVDKPHVWNEYNHIDSYSIYAQHSIDETYDRTSLFIFDTSVPDVKWCIEAVHDVSDPNENFVGINVSYHDTLCMAGRLNSKPYNRDYDVLYEYLGMIKDWRDQIYNSMRLDVPIAYESITHIGFILGCLYASVRKQEEI